MVVTRLLATFFCFCVLCFIRQCSAEDPRCAVHSIAQFLEGASLGSYTRALEKLGINMAPDVLSMNSQELSQVVNTTATYNLVYVID